MTEYNAAILQLDQDILDTGDLLCAAELVSEAIVAADAAGYQRSKAENVTSQTPIVAIPKKTLSDGRTDYYVLIKVGDREVTPHMFREEYKAAYHVALYTWILAGGEEPDLLAYGPEGWPAVPVFDEGRLFDKRRAR